MSAEKHPRPDTPDSSDAASRQLGWLTLTVMIVFGLFYAFDLFEALTNLFGAVELMGARNAFRESQDLAPLPVPWAVLLANVALPIVIYAVSWWLTRRRRAGVIAVALLAGLAVVAAYSITFTVVARGLL